jgi:hypothetical protein
MRREKVLETIDIAETPEDKGLTLTIKLTAYDNGILNFGAAKYPLNGKEFHDEWISAIHDICDYVLELKRRAAERQREKGTLRVA